jgi:flagellar hook assembly protein FlgD
MRIIVVAVLITLSSICLAQSDSMFVAKMDGTIRGYPISSISQITFVGVPTSVREQELVRSVISSFYLYQNYPNPFNPSTTIQYSVPTPGDIEARIFDIQGRLVRSLSKGYQQSGTHSLVWDSRGNSGTIVASGTYFCQVLFNGTALVKKLILMK